MHLLIVSATSIEIEPLLANFSLNKEINQKLKRYTYKTHTIDVLITGVGMVATAYWMGKTLVINQYDLALNVGIAGYFDDTLKTGDVVHVVTDRLYKLGAEDGPNFLSLQEMGASLSENVMHMDQKMRNNNVPLNNVLKNMVQVDGITVNTVHGNDASIESTIALYSPQIESMEGAAFFYACLTEGGPFAQIRALSNKVEKRNKEAWDIPLAVRNLAVKVLDILAAF